MQDCLSAIMDGFELSAGARQELDEAGFTILPGPVQAEDLASLAAAYDAAVDSAAPIDVKVARSATSSIVARSSTGCICTGPFSRHVVTYSTSHSSSAQCMHVRYGQGCLPRISTSISSAMVTAGLWSGSSSWLTSSETTTARLVSCRAHTYRQEFRATCLATARQTMLGKFWRAGRRAP